MALASRLTLMIGFGYQMERFRPHVVMNHFPSILVLALLSAPAWSADPVRGVCVDAGLDRVFFVTEAVPQKVFQGGYLPDVTQIHGTRGLDPGDEFRRPESKDQEDPLQARRFRAFHQGERREFTSPEWPAAARSARVRVAARNPLPAAVPYRSMAMDE